MASFAKGLRPALRCCRRRQRLLALAAQRSRHSLGRAPLWTYENARIKNLRVAGAGACRAGWGALHIHVARGAHYELFRHIIKLSDVFVNLGKSLATEAARRS